MERMKTDIQPPLFPDLGTHFKGMEKKRKNGSEDHQQNKHHPVRGGRIVPERFSENELLVSTIP